MLTAPQAATVAALFAAAHARGATVEEIAPPPGPALRGYVVREGARSLLVCVDTDGRPS